MFLQLICRQPLHPDYFFTAGLAGGYGNGGTRHIQKICEKFDAGVVSFPFTGGAVSKSLSASPTSPVIAFFFARGCTLTAKVAPVDVS
jgi:hypothetical protein